MTRNPTRTVQATWFLMLALQTIGAIDAKHKLPAPKQYVAIGVLWSILFLAADTQLGKLAARLSLLLVLVASVLGPFGPRLVAFLNMIAKNFAVSPPTVGATGAGAADTTGGTAPLAPAGVGPAIQTS